MAPEAIPTGISSAPEAARLAHEVGRTVKPHLLADNGIATAAVCPVRARRSGHTAPLIVTDPLCAVDGIAREAGHPTTASPSGDFLAKAFAPCRHSR